MKVIFLDVDGVLNSNEGSEEYLSFMEAKKLALLKELITFSHAAGVVLISDRRYDKYDVEDITFAFDEYEIMLLGSIRNPNDDDLDDNRGKQILDYLNENSGIDSICILDDNDDGISSYFQEEFILVDRYYGLTDEIVRKAIKILS